MADLDVVPLTSRDWAWIDGWLQMRTPAEAEEDRRSADEMRRWKEAHPEPYGPYIPDYERICLDVKHRIARGEEARTIVDAVLEYYG
jgi:hypothetical protein